MTAALAKEAYGPEGDPSRHVPVDALEARYTALPDPPKQRGRVRLLVVRRADGARETPASVELSVDDGLAGDGWSRRPPRDPNAQITVMRHDVALMIANGQAPSTFGDNVLVELDLSRSNLPAGTRLSVGGCVVEVTAEPHNGCAKFAARFGRDALRFINLRPLRDSRLRGIHWRVVRSGSVAVGDAIEVLSRGAPIDVREADFAWAADHALITRIRFEVFVDEQRVPRDIELDDRDEHCIHLLAFDGAEAVGTARIDIDRAGKIGRLAVLASHRRLGVGTALMQRCHAIASRHGLGGVWCHAQVAAVPFYASLGYAATGAPFLEADIEHRKMTLALDPAP